MAVTEAPSLPARQGHSRASMHRPAGQPAVPMHGKAILLFPKHANLQNDDERNQMRSGFPDVSLVVTMATVASEMGHESGVQGIEEASRRKSWSCCTWSHEDSPTLRSLSTW